MQVIMTSTHSVEPISPYSSAPQLQKTIVRLGRQPVHRRHHRYIDIITVSYVLTAKNTINQVTNRYDIAYNINV